MSNYYEVIKRYLVVGIDGELDHHMADKIQKDIKEYKKQYPIKYIIFNFEKTAFMDSSGIGMIMGRYKELSNLGGKIYVVNVNETVYRILKISGLLKIVEEKNSIQEIINQI